MSEPGAQGRRLRAFDPMPEPRAGGRSAAAAPRRQAATPKASRTRTHKLCHPAASVLCRAGPAVSRRCSPRLTSTTLAERGRFRAATSRAHDISTRSLHGHASFAVSERAQRSAGPTAPSALLLRLRRACSCSHAAARQESSAGSALCRRTAVGRAAGRRRRRVFADGV